MKGHLLIIFSCIVTLSASEELFTAQVELEALLDTQTELIEAVEGLIEREESRIKELKDRLQHYIERNRKERSTIIENPINAFLLVKGLTVDLDDLTAIISDTSNSNLFAEELTHLKTYLRFPSNEDLNGASVALARLQDTYLLDTSKMASGELDGNCCATRLNVEDCFELGRQNYNSGDHDHTILWMTEALARHRPNPNKTSSYAHEITRAEILEYLAFSNYQKGEVAKAIKLTEELLEIEPMHPRGSRNIGHYRKLLIERKGEDGEETEQTFTVRERRSDQVGFEKATYEALCRGEGQKYQYGTHCVYNHFNKPYFLIGPMKQEVVSTKPFIWLYHDVIYDDEIQLIKKLAQPKFKRATVHNHVTGELVTAQYRISKSAWLQNSENPVVDRINQRISRITGLDMTTAEELQVVNYGLGGHYEPHFDFARRDEKDAFKSLGTGNRIATFLFYMSDVQSGGGTVFPELGLTILPVKGAAAFWYNLLPDGSGDYSTRHAACPILLGTKWVANKWIHERGQEFRRPCPINFVQPIS